MGFDQSWFKPCSGHIVPEQKSRFCELSRWQGMATGETVNTKNSDMDVASFKISEKRCRLDCWLYESRVQKRGLSSVYFSQV